MDVPEQARPADLSGDGHAREALIQTKGRPVSRTAFPDLLFAANLMCGAE
jgi:hypothetical protein